MRDFSLSLGLLFEVLKRFHLNFLSLLLLLEQSFAALALRDAFNIRHHPPFVLEHCLQSGLWTIMSYKKFYLKDVFRQAYM